MSRRVRFRDLLPAGSATPPDDPVFSPIDRDGTQPQVLHSIFSPCQEAAVPALAPLLKLQQKNHPPYEPFAATGSGDLVTPRKAQQHRGDSHNDPNEKKKQQSPASFGNVSDILVSPSHTALSSLAASMDVSLGSRSPAAVNNNNKSIVSTSTAFRTLEKMEWLKLSNIQKCSSLPQLIRIMSVLQSERTPYPSLLRAAQERLITVRRPLPSNNEERQQRLLSPDTVMADLTKSSMTDASYMLGKSRTNSATQSDTSSLVMSLSTDADEEEAILFGQLDSQQPKPNFRPSTVADTSNAKERELRQQVDRLTQTIIEMEQVPLLDHSSYRYQNLQEKNESHMLRNLQQQPDADITELLQSVEVLREQNRKLQEQIQRETLEREQKHRASADVEKRLSLQVQQLQAQLTQSRDKSVRAESSFQRKQFELNQLLRAAQRNLERIKADRDAMIQCFLQATGRTRSSSGADTATPLSPGDQNQLMQDIRNRTASNQRALDIITRQLAESDRQRRTAQQAHRESDFRLNEALHDVQRMEHENMALMAQIQNLSTELSTVRKQLQELDSSGQVQQRMEYEERERKYKHIIQEMKEQLRTRENVVPVGLYRSAVAEAKQRAAECHSHKEAATSLAMKIERLEKQLVMRGETEAVPTPSLTQQMPHLSSAVAPPPKNVVVVENRQQSQPGTAPVVSPTQKTQSQNIKKVRIVSPKNSAVVTSELQSFGATSPVPVPSKTPATKATRLFSPFTPKSADRCMMRTSAVRAAGGRMALQKKLRQMRSPKPVTNTVEQYQQKLEQRGIRPLPLREKSNH